MALNDAPAGGPEDSTDQVDPMEQVDPVGLESLEEARLAAREHSEPWPELSASIKDRVRRAVVPSRPVLRWDAHGRRLLDARGAQETVPSRDLVVELRAVLRTRDFAAADVEFAIEEKRLTTVRVDVVARYGVPLPGLLDDVWGRVLATVRERVGLDPDLDPERDVRVRVVDVVDGDPALG